ncbi:MAG: DUF1571 domain-containing protein [Phycisphaerae bacterium]
MKRRSRLPATNRRLRIVVGIVLAGMFFIQCTTGNERSDKTSKISVAHADSLDSGDSQAQKVEHLARTDHIALLEMCLDHYDETITDYITTFQKQERIDGTLGQVQAVRIKFRDEPFSVGMVWKENAPLADRLLYVHGKYNNKMLVKPKGPLALLTGTLARETDDPRAMKNSLKPVTSFGFKRNLKSLLDVYRQAKSKGDLKSEYGGVMDVAGRKAVALIRYLPAKDDYPAKKTVIYIDLERLVPISVEAFNWDDELLARYIYSDMKFNLDLTDEDFAPAKFGMSTP